MYALLNRMRLNQKLALLALLTLLMVAVPTSLDITRALTIIRSSNVSAEAVAPTQALLTTLQALQVHRELTTYADAGLDRDARRKARQDVEQSFTNLATAFGGIQQSDLLEHLPLIRQNWLTIANDVDAARLKAPQSWAQHTALIREIIDLIEDVALVTGLSRHPDPTAYFLQHAVSTKLTVLGETLAQLGTISLAAQSKRDSDMLDGVYWRTLLTQLDRQAHALETSMALTLSTLQRDGHPQGAALVSVAKAAQADVATITKLAEAAIAGVEKGQVPEMAAHRQALNQALDRQRQFMSQAFDVCANVVTSFQQTAKWQLAAVLGILLVLAALGAWWMYLISHSLLRSARLALKMADAVSAGDLSMHVKADQHDEFGKVLHAMQRMTQQLQSLVSGVRTGAQSVSLASAEIAQGNLSLSNRTEQQAASLEETSSSMEELTSTVRQNTENARQANQLALSASEVAMKGGAVVREVVHTMQGISDSSKKIADIIGVIDGIAFQTNILALNAAVEAARAGEQGRGFAVVASEVRTLAQRSAAAAKEIKELITASTAEVETGTQLVDQAGHTMDEIVTSVKRVNDIMAEIATASQEQSAGIEQVNGAISQMDDVTQQNAALVEEAAAAAESLQEQASALVQAVAGFKLKADAGSSHATTASVAPTPAAPSAPTPYATTQAPAMVERRGPNRAKNVARLPANRSEAPSPAHAHPPPSVKAAAGGGWESF